MRALLTGAPDVSGVLLVDRNGVPVRSVHRSRFLLSMSGRYGLALYADRPAAKLGDPPRTVGVDATAWEVLDVVAVGGRGRTSDDVAVVDVSGRCVGVVRLADLVRALAENRVEEAAGLNPLTRLPGSDAITGEVDRRIADGRAFALSWLDVDHFKQVNDGAGFAAGDELIRAVGRALAQTAAGSARVGHIGGDDFLVLTDPEGLDPLAASVLDVPWSAGGRPVTLSLATVLCPPGSVPDHRQAAAWLAPLKKAAKGAARGELGAGPGGHVGARGPTRVGPGDGDGGVTRAASAPPSRGCPRRRGRGGALDSADTGAPGGAAPWVVRAASTSPRGGRLVRRHARVRRLFVGTRACMRCARHAWHRPLRRRERAEVRDAVRPHPCRAGVIRRHACAPIAAAPRAPVRNHRPGAPARTRAVRVVRQGPETLRSATLTLPGCR